ncbi:MAG: vanadium-dependent haloperoxidase, partial [Anaerolineae bacterium]|nr:vanadium-dependent haloperoxidase [Anaerolineae bacterium]
KVVTDSIAFGDTLGEEILAWVEDDNFVASREDTAAYKLPAGDGMYLLTGDFKTPAEPYWGSIRPFVLDGGYDCNESFNLEYSTDPDSTFYKQAQEVVDISRSLTPQQEETARFWVDTPGVSGTPAGHWVSIANQLVDQLDLTLDRMAMMHAMLGMGLADAFISCWYLKYELLVPRPITYIQENIRRNWQSYIQTPPFPEYPSGHSVVSAAASEVLTDFFGTIAFKDETHIIYDHEALVRSYTSFEAAATEAAISRLYGGIHYRAAIENGMRQGRCVGQRITSWITLSPVSQGGE